MGALVCVCVTHIIIILSHLGCLCLSHLTNLSLSITLSLCLSFYLSLSVPHSLSFCLSLTFSPSLSASVSRSPFALHQERGGMMAMTEVYCLVNRARGMEVRTRTRTHAG